MKVLSIFGTRPEAIKMAVLAKKLNETQQLNHKICITAQHRGMLDQVMTFFDLKADYDLDVMTQGQDLTDITSKVLIGLRNLFKEFKPDILLVHGDTTTCFAGALAGFYNNVKVAHVEAGLRTGDIYQPYPEEMNRVLVSRLTKYHFAPTLKNKSNLLAEGIPESNILITGNTVIDSLLYTVDKVSSFSSNVKDQRVRDIFVPSNKVILITGHRRENFGEGFLKICAALKEIAIKNPDIKLIYPVHLNPNVQKPVFEILGNINNVILTDPLDYPDFVLAMKQSWIILTDSGGVQEEAPSFGKPVLVMRDTSERPEAIEAGTVKLVGAETDKIISGVNNLLYNKALYNTMSKSHNPYGDGRSSDRIVDFLISLSEKKY